MCASDDELTADDLTAGGALRMMDAALDCLMGLWQGTATGLPGTWTPLLRLRACLRRLAAGHPLTGRGA
jgi:hypothetical protein